LLVVSWVWLPKSKSPTSSLVYPRNEQEASRKKQQQQQQQQKPRTELNDREDVGGL
jgi:hypothetical protein